MYLTVKETAEILSCSESQVKKLILDNKIRALYDGQEYLINEDQFQSHFKQVEKYKQYIEEVLNEPIPEDIDVKDED
ncbi:excisionase family DNA-binding protein [Cytobacillus gottheilii]|uniref:excisionase family DNA-binding protein n=1 Tax=Cytobacillus gottheilii TaxID=859144 RepID=UPI0009B9A24E|nr:excisionase family DNA-binding protein [Cytobacillus gottheilii]